MQQIQNLHTILNEKTGEAQQYQCQLQESNEIIQQQSDIITNLRTQLDMAGQQLTKFS